MTDATNTNLDDVLKEAESITGCPLTSVERSAIVIAYYRGVRDGLREALSIPQAAPATPNYAVNLNELREGGNDADA